MSQVQGKLLYHISRETNWKIGQELSVGENDNPFWCKCKNYTPTVLLPEKTFPLCEILKRYPSFPWGVSQDAVDWLYENLRNISTEFAIFVREQTFEDVRKEHFPQLPSRQKCIWITEKDQVRHWEKAISDKDTPGSLLKLELDGELFCGDACWLTADTFSSLEYANKAGHYWSGELSSTAQIEYLFCGTAIIKEITPIK